MSNSAVLDRPTVTESEAETDWVVLDDCRLVDREWHQDVEFRGQGADRYGLIPAGRITTAPPNLVVLPPVDDLD